MTIQLLARSSRVPLAFLLALPLLAPSALADDYWVDALHGSDTNGGTSRTDAWRTISHALTQLPPAPGDDVDVVHVLPGDYDTDLGEVFPLHLRDRVRIVGEAGPASTRVYGGLRVGIGTDPTRPETGAEGLSIIGTKLKAIGLETPGPERPVRQATFRDLVIESCPVALYVRARIAKSAGSSLVLEDTLIRSCPTPVDALASKSSDLAVTLRGVTIEDCGTLRVEAAKKATLDFAFERSRIRIATFLTYGVQIRSSSLGGRVRAVFRDSEVTAFCLSSYGMVLEADTLIERCTITGHDYGVVLVEERPAVLRDSILYGNYQDLTTKPGWTVTVERCDIDDLAYVGKNRNFSSDPLFYDPRTGDYRLRHGSPCIDLLPPSGQLDRSGRTRDVDGDLDSLPHGDLGANEQRTLDGPQSADLGARIVLGVQGGAGEIGLVQLSLLAPLVDPVDTPFGQLWLRPGSFHEVALVTTSGPDLPTEVLLRAPDDPALAGLTVGYQALVRSPASPAGAAWSNALGLTLH